MMWPLVDRAQSGFVTVQKAITEVRKVPLPHWKTRAEGCCSALFADGGVL